MNIQKLNDNNFSAYGKIRTDFNVSSIVTKLKMLPVPETGNIYLASCPELEEFSVIKEIRRNVFGEMAIEAGFCNGMNSSLNGMEFHRSPEVFIAGTDSILIFGKYSDIKNLTWDTNKAEIFFVKEGTCLECFPMVLHYSPCRTSEKAFRSAIILPVGTNTNLSFPIDLNSKTENRLLFMKNKWLIAHPEWEPLIKKNAYPGIVGENIKIDIPVEL